MIHSAVIIILDYTVIMTVHIWAKRYLKITDFNTDVHTKNISAKNASKRLPLFLIDYQSTMV